MDWPARYHAAGRAECEEGRKEKAWKAAPAIWLPRTSSSIHWAFFLIVARLPSRCDAPGNVGKEKDRDRLAGLHLRGAGIDESETIGERHVSDHA